MKLKQFDVQTNNEDYGILIGYASTWIREPDAYGDIVRKGAFEESLAKLKAEDKKIPFIWSHQMDNLKSYIGTAEAEEDDKGLRFVATFDSSEDAQKVRQMYKDGRLSKFSFAYNVLDEGIVTLEDGRKANELRKLDIYEVSAVLVPANSDASVVDVKNVVDENSEEKQAEDKVATEDQKLLNLQKFELLRQIKKYEKNKF